MVVLVHSLTIWEAETQGSRTCLNYGLTSFDSLSRNKDKGCENGYIYIYCLTNQIYYKLDPSLDYVYYIFQTYIHSTSM